MQAVVANATNIVISTVGLELSHRVVFKRPGLQIGISLYACTSCSHLDFGQAVCVVQCCRSLALAIRQILLECRLRQGSELEPSLGPAGRGIKYSRVQTRLGPD